MSTTSPIPVSVKSFCSLTRQMMTEAGTMRKAIRAVYTALRAAEAAKVHTDATVSDEMSECLRKLARPSEPGEKLKAIYGRLAIKTGLTYGQVKRIWKREWKVIPGSVVRKLDNLLSEHERKLNAEFATIKARTEALYGHAHDPGHGQVRAAQSNPPTDEVG